MQVRFPTLRSSHDAILAAFNSGRKQRVRSKSHSLEARGIAELAHFKALQILDGASCNAERLRAARELGLAYDIMNKQLMPARFDVVGLLGVIYFDFSDISAGTIASDERYDASASLMSDAALGLSAVGELSDAAKQHTNAASATMKKARLSELDIKRAKAHLEDARVNITDGTAEFAFHQAVMSMIFERKPAEREDKLANLLTAATLLAEAVRIFSECGHPERLSTASELARVVDDLHGARLSYRRLDAVLAHADDFPMPMHDVIQQYPLIAARGLESNPRAFGLDRVPEWFTNVIDGPLPDEHLEFLATARDTLRDSLQQHQASTGSTVRQSRWRLATLDWNLRPDHESYEALLSAAPVLDDHADPADVVDCGIRTVAAAHELDALPPVDLLLSTAAAFHLVMQDGDPAEAVGLLRDQPVLMRFIACDLCEHSQWDLAITVIESTRTLIHSSFVVAPKSSSEVMTTPAEQPHWVYVIHSHRGTYVVVKTDDLPAGGRIVPEVNGANLSELALSYNVEAIGLLAAQTGMPGHLGNAVQRSIEIVTPVVAAIDALATSDRGICLILCGLLVTLPVSAELVRVTNYPFVCVVPSRRYTMVEHSEISLDSNTALAALSAARAPGMPLLEYAADEMRAVSKIMDSGCLRVNVEDDVRTSDFWRTLTSVELAHFSGHSFSDAIAPYSSALLLDDGPLSVEDILSSDKIDNLFMMMINSCQSGQPAVTTLGDEYLGVSTALLYRGCRFVVGTLWNVVDLASYVLMIHFYSELSERGRLSLSILYECLRGTQAWARSARAADIIDFLTSRGFDVPPRLLALPSDAVPLSHPREWAAHYLSARSL